MERYCYGYRIFPYSGYYGGTIGCYSSRSVMNAGGPPVTVVYRTSGDTERFVREDLEDTYKRMGIKRCSEIHIIN